jgi:hypothetical protein
LYGGMPKDNSNEKEKTRVNLILERDIWGKIRYAAFEERTSASSLINETFKTQFKKGKFKVRPK